MEPKAPTKNIAGPPVYYPPGKELFTKSEASAAWRAGVSAYLCIVYTHRRETRGIPNEHFSLFVIDRVPMAREVGNTSMKQRVNQKVRVNLVPLLFQSVCHYVVLCHVRLCEAIAAAPSKMPSSTQLFFMFFFSMYHFYLSLELTNAFQTKHFITGIKINCYQRNR